jgi:hypothetical protein
VDHVSGDDAVQKLMERIYDQDGDAHPELQRLAFGHDEISQTRSRTLAACGVVHKSDLNLGLWPPAVAITLLVGAVKHITTLETLLSNRESRLYDMFVGVPAGQPPCFPTNAGGGVVGPDGVREARALRPRLGGPLPKDAETGWYMIDRNGESFRFILDYLRCGGEVALPPPGQQRQQLAIEARYFGLPELAAMCTVDSVASLAAACGDGITAAEILELPREQLQPLFAEQGVSVIFAARIRAEIDAEHARLAAEAGITRAVDALRPELARLGADVSAAGLRLLAGAEPSVQQVCALDQRAAQELGLSAHDAQLVGALRPAGVSDAALCLGFCVGNAQGQGAATFVSTAQGWATAVGGEPLDPSRGAVFWKATVAQCQQYHLMIGVIGNPQPAADSRSDPTCFRWDAGYHSSWAGGPVAQTQGGYTSFVQGDVLIFKLEARQLSLRVARLGAQTFTLNTNGEQGLRTCVAAWSPRRVEFSAAQPEEEY